MTIKGVHRFKRSTQLVQQSWELKGGGLDFSPLNMPLNIGWRSEAHIATKHAPFVAIKTGSFWSIKLKDEVAESLESVIKNC